MSALLFAGNAHSCLAAQRDCVVRPPAHGSRGVAAIKEGAEKHSSTYTALLLSARRTASGTNTGPIRDQPPSGKRMEFAGMTLMRFNAAGKIQQSLVFRWVCCDSRGHSGAGPSLLCTSSPGAAAASRHHATQASSGG